MMAQGKQTGDKSRAPIALIALILALMAVAAYSTLTTEYQRVLILGQRAEAKNYSIFADYYLSSSPHIEGRPAYGGVSAPLTLIVFSDIQSPAAQEFMKEMFPLLDKEYISTGMLRFYHKSYLTEEDFDSRGDNYLYANSLSCFEALDEGDERYFDYYFALFNLASAGELTALAGRFGIDEDAFADCLARGDSVEVQEDLVEVYRFGIIGLVPSIFIGVENSDPEVLGGVSDYQRLNRSIRLSLMEIGR